MKLTPQQAPLYGDCVVTVLLTEEDKVEDDVVFYLVFSGSSLHHCASTRKVSSDTLETIAPGHDCCETVKVLLCASREGLPVFVVAEEDFKFIQDEAYDAAQFLATSAGNQQALNFTRFLDRSGPLTGDVNSLDEKVALAFRHLKLPAEWNVLGTDQTLPDGAPRETLMHFAVRLGLLRLTWFLLQKPGGRGALSIHNQEGATPVSLALERGYHKLHQLLTQENAGEPDSWSSLSYEIPCGDCSVRHHRELDIYTLTSESESQHEPPLPGDPCTGHISKLMNIQRQLTKTSFKQMDSLLPPMVTAQDPSCLPGGPAADGQHQPCASEPTAGQQLSPEDAESSPGCPGSPAGQIGQSSDLSSVYREEDTDCSCQKKSKGRESKGEAELTPTVDPGAVPDPHSGGEHTGGLPSCRIRNGDPGTKSSAGAADQASPNRSDSVPRGDLSGEPGTVGPVIPSASEAWVPETAGAAEPELGNPEEAPLQRTESENTSTAGASDGQVSGKPASVPSSASATLSLGGHNPAKPSLVLSNGGSSTEKAADSETSRSCDENSAVPGGPDVLGILPAAETKISHGSEADCPSASVCEVTSASDLTFPRPETDVSPYQKSEMNSSHSPSQMSKSPIGSTAGHDKLSVASACPQNTVISRGVPAAKPCDDPVAPPESAPPELPSTQHLPTAICREDPQACTVTPDHAGAAQVPVDCCPLGVVDEEGRGTDTKLEASLTNTLKVAPHPYPAVPEIEKELVPGQTMTSHRTFSPAGGATCESVTKDDVLSFVPSQKETGTATSELHTAADGSDGPGGECIGGAKQLLDDRAAGLSLSTAALDLQPSMGNASPTRLVGEHQGPCLSAVPGHPSLEGSADSSLLLVGEAASLSDSILTEEGRNLVVSESSVAQGRDDKDKAVTSSSLKEVLLSSGTLLEEQRAPSGPDAPGLLGEPDSAACAKDRALHGSFPGAPSACLHVETQQNEEVAPPVSRLPEGGAAPVRVPAGASLAVDGGPEASGAAQSSSPPLRALLPDGSESLNCHPSFALDVDVKSTQNQGENSACEMSGNVWEVAVADAPPGPTGARRKGSSHSPRNPLTAERLLSPEKSMNRGVPGAPPGKGVTDQQAAATPEMVPLGGETGKPEGAEPHCHLGSPKEAQVDGGAQHTPLQPAARQSRTGSGLAQSAADQTPCWESGALPPPGTVSATAVPLPQRADAIMEAASRIVDAVIERVKASGVLMAKGGIQHGPQSSPWELGPAAGQLAGVSAGHVSACLPGDTPQVGNIQEEAPGALEGCDAGRKEPEQLTPPVPGPGPAAEMPDTKAEDEVDFRGNSRESPASEEVAAGSSVAPAPEANPGPETQAINRESWCTIEPCPDAAALVAPTKSPECENFLDVGLGRECASKQGVLKRESGSDSDLFHSASEDVDSILFSKPEEEQLVCDTTGSSSSTDDTASLDRHSSHGSDVSLPQTSSVNRSRLQQSLDGFYSQGVGTEGRESESEPAGSGDMEEEMDSITEVPANCSVLRSSMRSLSPFRRHSWGPGKNAASDAEMNQRSSMRVLGDVVRRPPIHRRSMSWCTSGVQYSAALSADFNYRSFSLEGLAGGPGVGNKPSSSLEINSPNVKELRHPFSGEDRVGSLVSLSEEDLESDQREPRRMFDPQTRHRSKQSFNYCTSAISSPLTKSISLMTISHPGLDHSRPFHSTSANLTESITEENYSFLPQSPSKKDFEGKSGTKVSRTFSYIKNKMSSSKKSREKEKEKDKIKEKEKDSKEKEKDKKTLNGHAFSSVPTVGPVSCSQCMKPFTNKDAYACASCSAFVHKGCRENLASCAKVKMKQPKGSLQAQDTSSLPTVIMRNKTSQPKERPRSAVLLPDETTATTLFASRRSQQSVSLSKSVSIQNIAGVGTDENMSNTWKFLSHSTDSLNKISKVNESTESLTDEGTDMNEGQLMGDFEMESKQLEAESWSRIVDSKFLKQQKKEVVKRQEVLYELMQTELHHIRTLKIMSDVYSRGMMTDLLFEQQTVEKLFPCLEELISIHSQFFQRILERKKESLVDKSEKNFLIKRMGDVLVNQFSGENAERLKTTYGKFCGQHNQSVNYFKDLYNKDKRFQAFVKKKMSSSVVRRLGIPECILLVTQRITKYPVLFQRILQCTKDNEAEEEDLAQSLSLVKDVIGAVDSKVASYEKKVRLNEIYTKTDSKSIMRMKSGQMFAKEDLKRKKLVRDGSVFLKNAAGRLKEVQAVLLTDILVFLQEKDQKYVFASLDQKSTVISLKKLIVREVAHEEKGLFLISMGVKDPEMVEVHAGSKEERNSWIQIIQDTINTLNRDEDEGIPSENEEEKKMLDTKARELKEQLQQKDQQILLLLEEKEMIFRDMTECTTPLPEDCSPVHSPRVLFRSNTEEALKGGPLMKSAINEVEILQGLVSGSLGGSLGPVVSSPGEQEGTVGPVSLPRRAETFGGFDSHQMSASKGSEKEDADDGQDLRRTESDSGLKKGGNANLVFMPKRSSEVIQRVVHLHELLSSLQGVVLQQDSYIEDQKLLLAERAVARSSARPSSLIEQEKQRSLEKQRQDLANLQRQRAQHLDEQRRRERDWDTRERALQEREVRLAQREAEARRGLQDLEREREELQQRKAAYQGELERLRTAQKQLEREKEQLQQDTERLSQAAHPHTKLLRIPSFLPSPEESPSPAPAVAKSASLDSELSASPKRNSLTRTHKDKGPFHILSSTSQASKAPEGQSQAPASASTRLFGLAKPKEKKEKKKKSKGGRAQAGDGPASEGPAEGEEIFC
ncbi:A-kinase anchor protein 13 isoform X3 [Talpa occidentalis]|uniref:A-kinase anchor protein 13 isoform X3 n=1 Tax=Talpa occidentalis TaxID=50954 RepID=UPI0023F6D3DA|nr:A-kinase anchor protein 13 isoform X3 [Talpa occidentalis]